MDRKDIKTQRFSIEPRQQFFDGRSSGGGPILPPEIVGFTITQTLAVTVRDLEKAGGLLSGAVDRGANVVSGVSFEVDDPADVENEARREAIANAREKAKAMAEAGGFRLGRLVAIDETGGVEPVFFRAAEALGGEGAPSLEPGSEEVTVTVTLTFAID